MQAPTPIIRHHVGKRRDFRRFAALILVSCLALLGCSARADLLASDNFTGSSGTGVGSVANTESTGVGTYTTVQGANGMSVTTLSGFGNGNVLSLANGTQTYYRPFDGASTLTLNSLTAGQTLRLAYTARFDGSFGGADNFSFGFVNFGSPNSILYANVDLSATGGTQSEFRYRTGSFNMSDAGLSFGTLFTNPTSVSTTSYNLELSVTRQVDNAYLIEYLRDSVLYGSTTQTNGSTFANAVGGLNITGVAFRHSQTPGVVTYLDEVTVAVVPEPFAGLLFLSGGALLIGGRRWFVIPG